MEMKVETIPQLIVRGVTKDFSSRGLNSRLRALEGVDLDVAAGEFVVLLGPSGCGKSTLLSILAGFHAPSAGQVLHEGKPIVGPDRRRTVVFQDYALFPWMTVLDNVAFGLKAQGISKPERHKIARRYIALVKLEGFEDRYPHEISGGMKQRAAIARALAPDPDILLMDEPFGALDPQTRVLLQEELARVTHETKKTVLFVTHSIDEAVFLADRIVVMSARPGRIRDIYNVSIDKPRTADTRRLEIFKQLSEEIWESLRPEWQVA